MADRYIVTTIEAAKASGKRAAGFAFLADAEAVCASLNRGRDPFVAWQNESAWGDCAYAILDTHTPAVTPGAASPAVDDREDDGPLSFCPCCGQAIRGAK